MAGEMNLNLNMYQKLAHRFLMLRYVSALLGKILHRADTLLLRLTGEQYAITRIVGLPIIQLTTKGARTGQPRRMPLVGLSDGEKILLIASNFGGKHNPGWYYNLKANPDCEVRFNGISSHYVARESFGDERETYFQMAIAYYSGYEKYRERAAHRHMPVMVLELKK